ncbi:MAG: glycosyl hydrolase [Firmicutes bacterium]|nr:glycosyl hydrolase [Candidatus Fermentithermobacillaceae bacterium]
MIHETGTGLPLRSRLSGRTRPWRGIFLVLLLASASLLVVLPSFLWVERPVPERPRLIYEGTVYRTPGVISGGEVYIPFDFIREKIDPDVFWDNEVLVITTRDKVIKLRTEELTAYINQHPVDLKLPVVMEGSMPYVPACVLQEIYPVGAHYFPDARTVQVKRLDVWTRRGEVKEAFFLREAPSFLVRRVEAIGPGAVVSIYGKRGGWLLVETSSGNSGYIREEKVREIEPEPPSKELARPYAPPKLPGRRVFLIWEQVDRTTPDPSRIGEMPGVNVVSPTWFSLSQTPGEVLNTADARYVRWAHSRGYHVWGLFSNGFDPVRTRSVIRDSDLRDRVIAQILLYAKAYSLDGINIDFENVYHADASYLTQFVRELVPMARQQGLVVSMDVTVKSESPNWSLCYERRKLAEVLDYVILMAYDQYPWGSPVAGPVSTIPWTEDCIKKTLEEVPREKLILGVPFYTRLWTERRQDGQFQVSSKALGMEAAEKWLQDRGITAERDPETGLRYVQRTEGDVTYKLWLEDEESMKMRMMLMEKYGLAGVAAWRRGFEKPSIYEVIEPFVR